MLTGRLPAGRKAMAEHGGLGRVLSQPRRGLRWAKQALDVSYRSFARKSELEGRLAVFSRLPARLHVEGTNACDARCVFCVYSDSAVPKRSMAMSDFARVVDAYAAMGGSYISLTPVLGEPLLDPFLRDRLFHLKQHPAIRGFHFYTNGIRLARQMAEELLRIGAPLTVFVSLGGLDREAYRRRMGVDRFAAVTENLKHLIGRKRETSSNLGVEVCLRIGSERPRGQIWQWLEEQCRKGLLRISRRVAYDTWGGKKTQVLGYGAHLPRALRAPRVGACHFLYERPIVFADLTVGACAARDAERRLLIGDLRRESLQAIWKGERRRQLIASHQEGDYPEPCRSCLEYRSVYDGRSSIWNPEGSWRDLAFRLSSER